MEIREIIFCIASIFVWPVLVHMVKRLKQDESVSLHVIFLSVYTFAFAHYLVQAASV